MKKSTKKILVVEDESALARALIERLEKEGFSVLWEKDGADGLQAAVEERPDLILLDIVMPVMDGMTMLSRLRKNNWGKTVPVILLTNLADADQVAEAHEHDVFDYLVKSNYPLEQVIHTVCTRLGMSD